MKLIFASLTLGTGRMSVVIEGDDKKQRRVGVQWMASELTDVPPANWPAIVRAEVEEQRSQEARPGLPGFLR